MLLFLDKSGSMCGPYFKALQDACVDLSDSLYADGVCKFDRLRVLFTNHNLYETIPTGK